MKKRIEEITSKMKSFRKEKYNKQEVLSQLLELQSELVTATFNCEHVENAKLRLRDVYYHFERLNKECGNIADEDLRKLKEGINELDILIKTELSGIRGENRAYRSLETLYCKNQIIRNVEFKYGDHRTEIDAVVITEKAVFIVEVKNTKKDILIDERGIYCRMVNDEPVFDKNIGERMNEKEFLLREALKSAGIENVQVVSFVVFTNCLMKVDNRYPYITTCYLSDLPRKIGGYFCDKQYSTEEMDQIAKAIETSRCYEEYPMPINISEFKETFATVLCVLENAKKNIAETGQFDTTESIKQVMVNNSKNNTKKDAIMIWINKYKKAIPIIASIGIVGLATIAREAKTKCHN